MPADTALAEAIDELHDRYRNRYQTGSATENTGCTFGCFVAVALAVLIYTLPGGITSDKEWIRIGVWTFAASAAGIFYAISRRKDKKRIKEHEKVATPAEKRRWSFLKVVNDRRIEMIASEDDEKEFRYLFNRNADRMLAAPAQKWHEAQSALDSDDHSMPDSIKALHEEVRRKTDETMVDLLILVEETKTLEGQPSIEESCGEVAAKFEEVVKEAQLSMRTFGETSYLEPHTLASVESLDERLAELREVRQAFSDPGSDQQIQS